MRNSTRRGIFVAGATSTALALTACSGGNSSETSDGEDGGWEPEGTVTMVVPFSVGGGSDLFGRAVADGLEEVRPGINVTVENREGGSGTIGYNSFLEEEGNPHYLLPTETGLISGPARDDELLYDWQTFTPIGMLVEELNWFVTNADSGWETFEEFVEEASTSDQPIKVGLPSADGTEAVPTHDLLEGEGIEVEPVVFDGGGEMIPALLSGDIDAMVANSAEIDGQVDAGEFNPLIGYGQTPPEGGGYEGVPATGTAGYDDVDLAFSKFRGIIAAPDIPDEAQQYYEDALKDWTETESFAEYINSSGLSERTEWGQEWQEYLDEMAEEFVAVYSE